MSWANGTIVGFDTETTGINPHEARLVTAAIIVRTPQGDEARTWLADPGVEIPEPAARVHGITTEYARTHGRPAAEVAGEVLDVLAGYLSAGHPVLAFNAAYDLDLIEAEARRHSLPTLADRLGQVRPVIDPLVLDRAVDRYRRGKRTLTDVARFYGVQVEGRAHNADIDVLLALGVAQQIAERYPQVGALDLQALHDYQVDAHLAWARNFIDFRRRTTPGFTMSTDWPVTGPSAGNH